MTWKFASGVHAPGRLVVEMFSVAAIWAAFAATPTVAQSFDDLAARLADHPSVLALREESGARKHLALAARALPDPAISLGVNNVPLSNPAFDRLMMTNKSIGLRQEIPNGGVRSARAARETSEATASDLRADYQMSLLRAELIGALADKQRIRSQISYAAEKLHLYKQLEDILQGEIEGGKAIYFRLSQVDVERADVERELADLDAALARADAALVDLVGEAPDTQPPAIDILPWNGEPFALYAARIADAGVETAKAGVAEGKAAYGPNFGVQLTYQQREAGDPSAGAFFDGGDLFSAGVTFSVPLWAGKNQAPRLRAAKAREAGAHAAYQRVYRDARQQLTTLAAAYAASIKNLGILQNKAKSLDESIASTRRNYEAGRGDYEIVLDAEIGRLTLLSELAAERARSTTIAAQANSQLVMQ